MKKIITTIYIGLFCLLGFAQTKSKLAFTQKKINEFELRNDSLAQVINEQNKIIKELLFEFKKNKDEISTKIDYQNQTLTLSTNSTSTSLTALNNYLDIWGILFSIFGILIGAYIVWAQNKMSNILKNANGVLSQQKLIQKEVNETQELIENDLTGLYLKLENQEVKILLARLQKTPEEMINLFQPLSTKELSSEHYSSLKEITLKYHTSQNPEWINQQINGCTLLIQHYPDKVLFDKEINALIFPKLKITIDNLFPVEIIDSTVSIINYTVNRNLQDFKEVLNQYFNAIKESNKFENNEIYLKSYESCLSKESKFKLFILIETNENFTKVFAKKLLSEFKNAKNSDKQNSILESIEMPKKN